MASKLLKRPTRTSPLDSFESCETELTRSSQKQWDAGIGTSSSFELFDDDFTFPITARENKAVSFLDKYEVLGGVPSFVFRPIGNDKWAFRNFAVSSDGTRMALAIRPDIIHVYDLLENFTLIAKADYRWCIDFLEFWNTRNDMLVVVFENRVVSIIAVIDRRGSFSPSHSFTRDDISNLSFVCNYHLSVEDDQMVNDHKINDQTGGGVLSNDVEMYWDFACEVAGSEMWIIQKNENGALFISTVSQRNGMQHLSVFSDCCNRPTRLLSCISQKAVMAVYEHEDLKLNRTRIWRALIFEKGAKKQKPVELTGQGLCWGCNGKYLLIWSGQENGRNQVELYLTSRLDPEEVSRPLISISIGFGVISLKAQFLNKEVVGGEVVDHGVPLIALLVTRSNGTSLLVWDCYINDIIMEKDLTIEQVEISHETRFEFCVSANLRWIAIGCWQTGVIGLFSFRSGTLLWTCELELCQIDDPCFIPMMFDPLSSKLIINSDNTLFVFIPPCLIDHQSIYFQSSCFDLDVKSQDSIPDFDEHHQKLMPKHVLGYLLALSLQSRVLVHSHYMYHIDIATSNASSKLAVLVSGATSVSIFLGTIEVFSSPAFRSYLEGIFSVDHISHNFDEIKIKDFPACPKFTSDGLLLYVFLYPTFGAVEESIAVFSLEDGVVGLFIDPANRKVQKKLNFATGHWFAAMQSKDNTCLTCLGEEGVLIVDLSHQLILQHVHYKSNLAHRLHCFFTHNWEIKHRPKNYTMRDIMEEDLTATNLLLRTKKAGGFDISPDGKSILLGWDIIKRKRLLLTADLTDEECEELQKRAGKLAPCWALDEDLEMVAYLEFDDNKDSILAIGTYNNQNEHHFRMSINQWSPHLASILQNVSTNDLLSYALQMDHDNGCLWLIILTKDGHSKAKTTWVPISPYSAPDCVPCFYSIGYPTHQLELEDLKMLTSKFGASSMFNMAFNGISNFQMIIEQRNESILSHLIGVASEEGVSLDTRWKRWDGDRIQQSCLRKAIDKKDDLMSKVALESLEKILIPFQDTAFMFKECFQDLWTYYHTFMESILVKNLVSRPQCQVEVPLEIFNSEQHTGARLGTSNTILEWKHESNSKQLTKTWNHANQHHLEKIERHGNATTRVLASMEFFCVDDICKLGLNGIIRFLLMQKAPSFIFKTNMIQCVIVWKWENLWKARCCRYFLLYLCFLVLFSIYAVFVEFVDNKGDGHTSSGVFMSLLLFILMLSAMLNLSKEYTQMRTYIRDGQILFPKSQLWGLKYYFISRWNIIEVIAYILLLFIIPVFHFLSYMDSTFMPVLYSVVAIEALLVYSKLWYFAQAFRQTGALVFMIENVLRDCMSFLLMAFVVLVGFSISIFIVVRHFLDDHTTEKEDDSMQAIHASFGSLLRVMVTLFYVMLGMFEPEVFFLCGSLSPLIIVIFVAYLSTQMIVMLNMLIAIMGDTFDRVKNSEEEQLLLGKARLIDACEAALTEDEVQKIEQGIGKYLYVLFPVGQPAHRDFNLWRGKPRSVEDNVRRIIDEHEETMKAIVSENHDDFMVRMQDAKDLLMMTMQTVGEFEKRCRDHASEIEVNLTRTIEERSKILEKYLIINHGRNPSEQDSSSNFRTTRVVMHDSLLRAHSQDSEDVLSQSGSI